VYKDQKDEAVGRPSSSSSVGDPDGQKMEAALDYAPLPKTVVEKVDNVLKQISFKGKTLY